MGLGQSEGFPRVMGLAALGSPQGGNWGDSLLPQERGSGRSGRLPQAGARGVPGSPKRRGSAGSRGLAKGGGQTGQWSEGSRGLPRSGGREGPRVFPAGGPRPPCWLWARASSCAMTRSMAHLPEVGWLLPRADRGRLPSDRDGRGTGYYGPAEGPHLSGGEALRGVHPGPAAPAPRELGLGCRGRGTGRGHRAETGTGRWGGGGRRRGRAGGEGRSGPVLQACQPCSGRTSQPPPPSPPRGRGRCPAR